MNENKRKKEEEKIIKLKQELLILKTLKMKVNYSELARIYELDRRTIKKYHDGYDGKRKAKKKKSSLDKYKEEIKEKLSLPGATISATYQYFKNKYNDFGTYSKLYKYVKKEKLKPNKTADVTLRFETPYGKQMQFDWKEDIKMISKHGELFEFNVFSATLGASRLHYYVYSKNKTRIDVERCLVKTFEYIGGIPEEILTDNMSSIVNEKTKKINKEFVSFAKDMNVKIKKCKPRRACTKGKVESSNRFVNWLIPYNHEFEDEKELIEIIKNITYEANKKVNSTIGTSPIMLFKKEKEYLQPLPNKKILQQYSKESVRVKVSNESLFYYKKRRYSVSPKYIGKILDIQEDNNNLYVYYNKNLITIHAISEKNINYHKEHYEEGLAMKISNKDQIKIK